jgi:hypothetical protein
MKTITRPARPRLTSRSPEASIVRSKLLIALAAALVAACASTEKARESWNGATYDDFVRAWGQPQRSGKLSDGSEVHTWLSQGAPVYRSGPSVGIGTGVHRGGGSVGVGVGFPIGGGSVSPPAACERTLTFRDGRLVEQSWIGPDEICAEYARAG